MQLADSFIPEGIDKVSILVVAIIDGHLKTFSLNTDMRHKIRSV